MIFEALIETFSYFCLRQLSVNKKYFIVTYTMYIITLEIMFFHTKVYEPEKLKGSNFVLALFNFLGAKFVPFYVNIEKYDIHICHVIKLLRKEQTEKRQIYFDKIRDNISFGEKIHFSNFSLCLEIRKI